MREAIDQGGSAGEDGGGGAALPRKAVTRQRILSAAGALFRRHGIDGIGVDAVMRAAGRTHGGFYAHFPSKEALAAEVCSASLARSAVKWRAILAELGPDAALPLIVETYLSPRHAFAEDAGCVLPMLGPELARREGARLGLSAPLQSMIETLAACLPGAARGDLDRARAALATMVGAIVLARMASDPEQGARLLAAARAQVLG